MLIPTALVFSRGGPSPLDPTAYALFVVCYVVHAGQFLKDNNHNTTYTMTRLAFALLGRGARKPVFGVSKVKSS